MLQDDICSICRVEGALNVLVLYSQGNYHAMQDPQSLNEPNQIDRYVVQRHFVPFRDSSVVNVADSVRC